MNDNALCRDVLIKAAEAIGGGQALAKLLRRDLKDLEEWLDGKQMVPMDVYLEACRLLSDRLKDRDASPSDPCSKGEDPATKA